MPEMYQILKINSTNGNIIHIIIYMARAQSAVKYTSADAVIKCIK